MTNFEQPGSSASQGGAGGNEPVEALSTSAGIRGAARLDTGLVQEICDFLTHHKGLSPKGTAHPIKERLPIAEVEAAIDILTRDPSTSVVMGLKPYHLTPALDGCWQRKDLVNEVLEKKCDALVRDQYDGDLARFCREVDQKSLLSPLIENIGGREVSVSMRALAGVFGASPYKMAKRYLEIKGKSDDFAKFKPYHMERAPRCTWQDDDVVNEVLQKKCDALVRDQFGDDLARFCIEVKRQDLGTHLEENIGGREVSVSMGAIAQVFEGSPYKMVKRYLEIKGKSDDFAKFKPYHMKMAPQGTWQDADVVNEVLEKKCDALVRDQFGDNLTRFCREVDQKSLLSPLIENIGGREVSVSMDALARVFGASPYKMVKRYLEIKGKSEDFTWFKPYHMEIAPQGTWQVKAVVNEVLQKKCDALVRDQFGADLTRFCIEVDQQSLLSPLIENIGGREVPVSMSALAQVFRGSPYKMVKRYLEIKGKSEDFASFKPYHMKIAPLGSWHDEGVVNEVLQKKCDTLVRDQYDGDLDRFCIEVDQQSLLSPLIENIGGREVSVSMVSLAQVFGHSPYKMAKRYLEIKGKSEDFASFKPYHMNIAPMGTWQDDDVVNEVLEKKCDALVRDQFGGDLAQFLAEVTTEHLLSPLKENIGGREVSVSMSALAGVFGVSRYKMVKQYLEIKGKAEDFAWFKPYHMKRAPQGTWQDADVVNEVLQKKCDALVRDQFGDNLTRFCIEVDSQSLLSPLIENIGGREVSVSMVSLAQVFGHSPYKMVKRYLEIKGKSEDFAKFKPYHMKMAPHGTWQDDDVVNEVLQNKCDALVRDQFGGDLARFCTEVHQQSLKSPLIENIGGREVSVSMSALAQVFGCSSYKMVKQYFKLIRKKFPYKEACFVGSPETRSRRMKGELSAYDLRLVRGKDGTFDTRVYGFKNYKSRDKEAIRELMLDTALEELGDRDISYLGLETEQFFSLRGVYQRLNLSPKDSLVVEANARTCQAMRFVVKNLPNGEGKALRDVRIVNSLLEKKLETIPAGESSFNVANLDYLGHLSQNKEYALQLLLSKKLLAPKSLVFVTLQDTQLARTRAKDVGYSEDQAQEVSSILSRLADLTGHRVQRLAALPYRGGGDGSQTNTEMLWIAFRIERDEEEALDYD